MNGAVFISRFLQTRDWKDAANALIDFWTDPEKGLGSNINDKITLQLQPWLKDEEWYKEVQGAASKEAASGNIININRNVLFSTRWRNLFFDNYVV